MKKNDSVDISVIMATYKTPEEYLILAIDSILNQTFKNFELIIVCDGDSKEYEFLKNRYGDLLKVNILLNKKNSGLPFSLNRAIRISKGKYIARMDSDDIALKNRLKLQFNFMEKHPDYILTSTSVKLFGNVSKKYIYPFKDFSEVYTSLFYGNLIVHPSVMIRKNVLIKNNIFYDERFLCSQDYELWSRLKEFGKFHILNDVCLLYRIHDKQISSKKKYLQMEAFDKILIQNFYFLEWNYDVDKFKINIKNLINFDSISNDEIFSVISFIDEFSKLNKINKDILIYRFFLSSLKSKRFLFHFSFFKYFFYYKNYYYLFRTFLLSIIF